LSAYASSFSVSLKLKKEIETDMVQFEIKCGAVSNVIVADHQDYEVTVDVLNEYLPSYFTVIETTLLVK
jgi:hypothetical protein